MPTESLRRHGDYLEDVSLASRLNALLRDGGHQLDFTGVTGVGTAFVATLLAGLDLGKVGESLGAETMSPAVAAAFEGEDAQAQPVVGVAGKKEPPRQTLNPLRVLADTVDSYRDYLVTEFRARDESLRRRLEEAVDRPGFLAQEPYFSTHIPFRAGKPWAELPLDPRLAAAFARRTNGQPTYLHQQLAIEELLRPDPSAVVVTTGTGSGKTECFLAPVLQAAIEDSKNQGHSPGLVALILYPMNALANDQLERIRWYLQSSRFGDAVNVAMYNRGTSEAERDRMRQRPPHLLLTNYQMLEYLLTRPADRESLFAGHRCRFVVLDEVHTYRGTLGTHVALLFRRLKAHLRRANPAAAPFVPVGTSATIRSEKAAIVKEADPTERARAVQQFFGKLVGTESAGIVVVGEAAQDVVIPDGAAYSASPPAVGGDVVSDPTRLSEALSRLAGVPDGTALDEAGRRCRILWDVRKWLGGRARSVSELVELVAQVAPGRAEWREEDRRNEVQLALEVGARLQETVPGSLQLRVHGFVRGGWQFHRCVDPACGTIHPKGEESCVNCGRSTAPLYLCRHCGADFLRVAGNEAGTGALKPFPESGPPDTDDEVEIKEWLLFHPERWSWREEDADETQEAEEEETLFGKGRAKGASVYETVDGSFDPDSGSFDRGRDTYPHPASLWPTRKKCPSCQNSAPRPLITRVSLGTSAAVKVLSEGLLEALPAQPADPKKRLLVFCDSRQDAAHQARFIAYARRYDRMRTRVVKLLRENGPLSIQKVVEGLALLGFQNKDNPNLQGVGQPRGEALQRVRAWEEAPLLDDLAVNTRYRATLENLGLVRVRFDGVDQMVVRHGKELEQALRVPAEHLSYVVTRLLDGLRRMGALRRPLLAYHPFGVAFPDELKAALWERRLQNPVGLPIGPDDYPALRHDPDEVPAGVSVKQVWSETGFRTSAQKILLHFTRRLADAVPTAEGVERLLRLLAEESFLAPAKLYGYKGDVRLYQVSDDCLHLEMAVEGRRQRCGTCALVVPDAPPAAPCPRCMGSLQPFTDSQVRLSRYAKRALNPASEPLDAREHTAQVSVEGRKDIEEAFKAADKPVNLLACTPTLEMGIDVGGLDAIVLRNVPPRPDNYAQRGGRAGRRSRVGLVVGYARATPHDQYFFEHADEMIAGAVPSPVFLLGNQDAVARHLNAIACGLAEPGLPSRMGDFISFAGAVQQEKVDQLKAALVAAVDPTVTMAVDAFGADVLVEAGFAVDHLRSLLQKLPERVEEAINRTAAQVGKLRAALDVFHQTGERKREANRTGDLINRLLGNATGQGGQGDDGATAYPLRRLAEFGLLPGYEFPSEPATLRLMGDDEESHLIQSGREMGLRQYQPNAPVYARGRRWKVTAVDLASPWNPSSGQAAWRYVRCRICDLVRDGSFPKCPRCATIGAVAELPSMAYAGFLARLDNSSVADEEERWGAKDNVQVHPSWEAEQVAGRWRLADGLRLEWRRGEIIYWLNEGPEVQGVRNRYPLCPDCGKLLTPPPPDKSRKKAVKVPLKPSTGPDPFNHAPNCARKGQPVEAVALHAQQRVETLRLLFPWEAGDEHKARLNAWAWTLGYSLLAGAERLFALSSRDFDVQFEGLRAIDGPENTVLRQGILTFIDPNLGGSGYLERFAERLPDVATAALQHLDHADCATACYRCLKSYDNQRTHEHLQWPLVVSTLEGLREDTPAAILLSEADINDPRPWREAYEAGVGSPLEHRCLLLLQRAGLEPVKQYGIAESAGARAFTVADFAFPDRRLALYVDGASFHLGGVLLRDRRIETRLKEMEPAWTVIRLGRKDIDGNAQGTAERIKSALR